MSEHEGRAEWSGHERRLFPLSDEEVEMIARRAAEINRDSMKELLDSYAQDIAQKAAEISDRKKLEEVGRMAIKGLFYLVGLVLVGVTSYLAAKGYIRIQDTR